MKYASLLLLIAGLSAPAAAGQIEVQSVGGEPMMIPPQAGRETKTGTGRIKGRLLTADTGAPVRRAQVRLSGTDVMPKVATTDNEGAYEFRDLPAGRFTINATKSGYVSVGYGQTRPFESGKPIELADGQVIERADISMPKGSVISGRIIDEFGEPMADAAVSALRSTWTNGRRRLQPTGRTAMTNDLGQYRLYGLPPGDYYVSASLRSGGQEEVMMLEMAMAVRATAAGGSSSDPPRSGYSPTYYPGTPNGGEAQKLALTLGQEAQNTDFGLIPVRLARISGMVISSDGRPLDGVMVQVRPRTAAANPLVFPGGAAARTDKAGNFTLNGVAPGDYTLNAQSSSVITEERTSEGNRMVFTARIAGSGGGDGQSEFGSVPLSVGGDDMSNIVIATSKGVPVSGRVVYEGGTEPSRNTLRISAANAEADGPAAIFGGSSAVTADGTFEIKGVLGRRLFRVSNVPAGWVLKAVRLNGTDITDEGLDITPNEPVSGVEVVLTTQRTEVAGSVKSGNDPATDYTVVIFSDDPQKWTVPMPRHITSARPNQEGRFQVKDLPAGSYYAIALEYIPQGDWFDPDVLDRLKARAHHFSLDEGAVQTLDLRLEVM